MIVLVGGQKGGTGKSTIATNLAVWLKKAGHDILIVDGNPTQATAANWVERRMENEGFDDIQCVEKSGNLNKVLRDLASKYDALVVDTGGQDSKEFRSALLAADMLITPIRPSPQDIETLGTVSELIEDAKMLNEDLIAKVVITFASTHPGVTLTDETKELLSELDEFELLDTVVHMRTPYVYASTDGAGVIEMDSSANKAKDEIESLAKELFSNE